MPFLKVTPLGAGQDVGRSCILLSIGGKNVMLDCGMHMGYQDERRFPDFSYISGGVPLTDYLHCVIISHFHLDHCGALPYMTEMVGYEGPIYMTYPTKAIAPVLLEDFRKVQTEYRGETNFFTSQMIKTCMRKVTPVNVNEEVNVDDKLSIQAFYAGHVLGAAMFLIKVGSESVIYTGDFNTTADRHLGAAHVEPGLKPDLLISETTYATTIRDSKRARERDFLKKVHDCVANGGKVLIPVFALGRAQELCILLESYWERMDLTVPIFFSHGLAEKATQYYRLFISWTNEKIKRTFVHRNMFDFKHIRPFDQSFSDSPGPMVLFSTPGMLHGGQSLRVFKKWCSDEKNMVIMPGFCVAGTIGAKVIGGAKKVEIDGKMLDINLGVEYMSFSAHADAKGIMQLIRQCEPKNVMFVHGENAKMEFLKEKVEKEFGLRVYKPANGESICVDTELNATLTVPSQLIDKSISLDPTPSKKFCPFRAYVIMDKQSSQLEVISAKTAARQFNVNLHTITFSDTVEVDEVDWSKLATKLRRFDPNLEVKKDGLEMFGGEVLLAEVSGKPNQVEVIWDELREKWFELISRAITEKCVF
uniref:Integrator complex subunit 11 n=1 Tax=Ascaris suum TaxID=6253 RepID=F1KVT5_ASCSU